MVNAYQQYEVFNQHRQSLASLIDEQQDILQSLKMSGWTETLARLKGRVLADNFKVLVVGEFKRGKSTFINALLRQEVLPAYAIPCTAIINEVKWGEEKRAFLHPRADGDGQHGNGGRTKGEPVEVPVDKLTEYVVIKDFSRQSEEINESPYEKAELFWPLELCRHGVEIIDSPGLNENEVRQQITINYLSNVDAVLFVLSCEALGPSISESDTIEKLESSGHEDIFFICNRFDAIRPNQREMIVQHGVKQLSPHTKRGSERVFFISAQDALDGYLGNSDELVRRSGLPPLEASLERFLATERGRVKLIRVANELKASIREGRRVIPEREDMLRTDMRTLEERYAAAQEPFRRLEAERRQIVSRVANARRDVQQRVAARAEVAYRSLVDKVDGWVGEYEVKAGIKLKEIVFSSSRKDAMGRVVAEILGHLATRIDADMNDWQKKELQPLLKEIVTDLSNDLDKKVGDFLRHVDDIRVELAPTAATPDLLGIKDEHASPLNRALSAIGGVAVMDIGSGAMGAVFGHKEMLRSLLPQLALQLVTIALVGLNPVAMVGVAIAQAWFQSFRASGRVDEAIKKKVAEKYAAHLRATAASESAKIGAQVGEKFGEFEKTVDKALSEQTNNVREQVETVLSEKQTKGADVEKSIRELKTLWKSLNDVDGKLDDLIAQIALA